MRKLQSAHGGSDPGAVYEGRREKDDNLSLAIAVGELLSRQGVSVIYTRTTDVYQTPFEKAQMANQADADFFISFHRNSSEEPNQYTGVETLVYDNSGIKQTMAENIKAYRNNKGLNQYEFAEKLGISPQAVSKWESAQSTPDLQKVLRLAEIFGVSTDYLLKDELKSETGTEILEYAAEESSVRSVSMEEANAFMEWRRKTGPTLAGAVALCIISPALLIFLAGLSDSHIGNISENMATGAGISVLLLLVAAAVVIFVSYSIHGQQYEYLEKERIETAYGVTGLVQERKKDYESTFTRGIAAGVTLCILAVIPMFAAIAFSQPDYIITATVSILLLLVAVGVFFIVRVSTINGSYVILLQEGEYTPEEKRYKKKTEVFTTAYWCIVTAIYLAWSFQTREWDKTWILWAVAGVLFGGVRAVMRGRIKEK